jgi:hypothetical protein
MVCVEPMRKKKTRFRAYALVLTAWLLGCLNGNEASLDSSKNAHLGAWSFHSVMIEKTKVRVSCEKDSTLKALIQSDTLEVDSSYPEFKTRLWELVITDDSIYSPNSIEDRIRFDWAVQPMLSVDNEFLSEGFHYKINVDSLILGNRRIDANKNVRFYYRFQLKENDSMLNLFPGIHLDATGVPSPSPNVHCIYLDSIEWKATLISASLRRH